jgi:SPP1 family predicted phage head-tail adaptor
MSLQPGGNTDPGRLDRRVILQSPSESRADDGGVDVTWVNVASVWASRLPTSGGRLYAGDGKHFEAQLTYRIRHRTDIEAGWRLVHADDTFEITGVAEAGRRAYLDLELRGIDQSTGDATDVGIDTLILEGTSVDSLLLEDSEYLLLETS